MSGARHDTCAFEAFSLKGILEKSFGTDDPAVGLGYIGVEGIGIVPFKKRKGSVRAGMEFNASFSRSRAAVGHAVPKVKTWQMLNREGDRYRCPIDKSASMLAAVTGLFFFAQYSTGE